MLLAILNSNYKNDRSLVLIALQLSLSFSVFTLYVHTILFIQNEIQYVLDLDVSPDRIIFANPIKPVSHLKYAERNGVKKMTFDNTQELYKIKEHFPTARY